MHEFRELCVRKLSGPKQDMLRSNAMWDRRAKEFRRMIEEEEKEQRGPDPAIALLKERAAAGSTVLDVGCGAGRHLVQLNRAGFRPEGLEPSAEMRNQAREHLSDSGISPESVKLHGAAFQDFRPEKQYDYLFLSNSPVLSDYENYPRLLSLARQGLLVQSWLSLRDSLLESVEGLLHRRAYTHAGPTLLYFMNLLFSDGYYPEFRAVTWNKEERVNPETLCQRYTSWFFGDAYSEAELQEVRDALNSLREEDGRMTVRRTDTMGILFLGFSDSHRE